MLLDLQTLIVVHVAISFAAIGTGLVVAWGLVAGRRLDYLTAVFLVTTLGTTATGFLFPLTPVTPAHVLGVASLVTLGVAVYARYFARLGGRWRVAYVITALASLHFNCFALVVQAFQKVSVLHALSPTMAEPPFAIAQAVMFAGFVATGWFGVIRFAVQTANVTTGPS